MADIFPQFPVQIAAMRQWPSELINWFVRMRYVLIRVAAGHVILPIGNRVVVTDSAGELDESDITDTELDSLDGIQSNVQNQIDTKFNISASNDTIAWDDAKINVGGLKTVGTGVPSFVDINSTGSYGWDFNYQAVVGNEKRLAFEVQLPHSYKPASEIRVHVHYVNETDPGADETARFQVVYTWTDIGDVLSAATINYDELIANGTTAYSHLVAGGGDFHIDGTGMSESSVLMGTLRRNSSHANDDYGDSVYIISVDVHVQKEKAGTPNEFPA